jgi:hypothetical protein
VQPVAGLLLGLLHNGAMERLTPRTQVPGRMELSVFYAEGAAKAGGGSCFACMANQLQALRNRDPPYPHAA